MTREEILSVAKPILFNTEMVRAILDEKNDSTRRPIKVDTAFPKAVKPVESPVGLMTASCIIRPKYQVGDYLYVRETWCTEKERYYYKADNEIIFCKISEEYLPRGTKWRPSIHMPKEASRIFLQVTDITPQRIEEITDKQASKEGFSSRAEFISAFLKMYPKCTEDSWVWGIVFERTKPTEYILQVAVNLISLH